MSPRPLVVCDLGTQSYQDTWELQKQLRDRRIVDSIDDHLILVEHPPVITVGRKRGAVEDVLHPQMIPVVEIERGGGATYHGPGQLVGYPILKLAKDRRDLARFLRDLEETITAGLAELGLSGRTVPGLTGVWVGDRKIASIGIAVKRWVTFHGFALNVDTKIDAFEALNPCGMDPKVMTSIAGERGSPTRFEEQARLRRTIANELAHRLDLEPRFEAEIDV